MLCQWQLTSLLKMHLLASWMQLSRLSVPSLLCTTPCLLRNAVCLDQGCSVTAAWHMVGAIQWQSRQSELTIFPLSCCCSVNNAGFTWDGVLHKITPEQWDVMLSVHCTAPFRLVQAASLYMRDAAKKVRCSGVGAGTA